MTGVAAPIGRAARLRLLRRLDAAARGVELLERKRHVLAGELSRLRLLTDRTGGDWQAAAGRAQLWLERSRRLDGLRLIEAAAPAPQARVLVRYRTAMGLVYPYAASCDVPGEHPVSGSSALVLAGRAHREALAAAAEHAAAVRARACVEVELTATAARERAIRHRRIPDLVDQLRRLELQLDELDREEGVRMRWSSRQGNRP